VIARKAYRVWSNFVGEKHPSSRILDWFRRLWHNLYYLSTTIDRYRRYKTARQQAAEGVVAICDRYPLAAIHRAMEGPPMDGPRIGIQEGSETDGITQKLAQLEQTIYQKILPPDHIFVLHVSPEVSQLRKPDHDLEMIENKSRALKEMDDRQLNVTGIDADQPLEQVLLYTKTHFWPLL
jgi:thymidylate kinase